MLEFLLGLCGLILLGLLLVALTKEDDKNNPFTKTISKVEEAYKLREEIESIEISLNSIYPIIFSEDYLKFEKEKNPFKVPELKTAEVLEIKNGFVKYTILKNNVRGLEDSCSIFNFQCMVHDANSVKEFLKGLE